jgi:hypothetical protein
MFKKMIIIFLILILIGISVKVLYYPSSYNSVVTSGYVLEKNEEDMSILLLLLSESKEEPKEQKVMIEDENVFNLVETERSYFVTYYWKNDEAPYLGQIEINDMFLENYRGDIIEEKETELN